MNKRAIGFLIALAGISVFIILYGMIVSCDECTLIGITLALLICVGENCLFSYWDNKVPINKKIEHEQSMALKVLPEYLKKLNASAGSVRVILVCVKEYYEQRMLARNRIFDKSFAFLISGLFVSGFGQMINHSMDDSPVWMVFGVALIVIALFSMIFIWAFYDFRDDRRKASISKTRITIRALECVIVYDKELFLDAD